MVVEHLVSLFVFSFVTFSFSPQKNLMKKESKQEQPMNLLCRPHSLLDQDRLFKQKIIQCWGGGWVIWWFALLNNCWPIPHTKRKAKARRCLAESWRGVRVSHICKILTYKGICNKTECSQN